MSQLIYGHGGLDQETQPIDEATLAAAAAAATPDGYLGAKVALLTGAFTGPYKELDLASLLAANPEPTYTGYARSAAITWGAPVQTPGNDTFISGDKKQFLCTADSASPDVTGAALVDSTGLILLRVDKFDNPVTVTDAGDGFDYVPVLSFVAVS